MIAGTFCNGTAQGSQVQKYGHCSACEFYWKVVEEEYPEFRHANDLQHLLE